MKRKILFHFAIDRNGGEFRRIYRICKDFDKKFNYTTIEVIILPIIQKKKIQLKTNLLGDKQIILPIILPFGRLNLISFINTLTIRFFSSLIRVLYEHDLVFGETHLAYNAIKGAKCPKIIDIHGAYPEESKYSLMNLDVFERINRVEKKMITDNISFIFQSEMMKTHIEKKHNIIIKQYTIYKCGVDINLFNSRNINNVIFRKEIGYNESDFIFIYVGGLQKWQLIYNTLDIFKEIKLLIKEAKYLILSQDDSTELNKYCKKNNIKNVFVLNKIPYVDVHKYISISNMAWLIRDNNILNKVASPTKLGEYLSCGIPVIVSEPAKSWLKIDDYRRTFCMVDHNQLPHKTAINIHEFILSGFSSKEDIREIAVKNLSSEADYNSLKHFSDN